MSDNTEGSAAASSGRQAHQSGALYPRILVPIDGSTTARRGLLTALQFAREIGSQVRVLHIVDEWIVGWPEATAGNPAQLLDALRTAGEALLDEAESTLQQASVVVDTVLVEAFGGRAGDDIVTQAKSWPADLIVIGTHGRRGLRRLVMGSDAERVVRHAPVPVLLIRADDDSKG